MALFCPQIKRRLHQFMMSTALLCWLTTVNVAWADSKTEAEELPQPRILVIGGVHSQYQQRIDTLEPMADYVQAQLSTLGPIEVVTVLAQDREHLAHLVRHGRVDWISQTAYNATYFLSNANMAVLARAWRGGSPTYKSVFFVRKESTVQTLNDLRNHTIAFEHPYSTSAFFVPKLELETVCKNVEFMPDISAVPRADSIGYTFSKSEYNTALWVQKGIVDAGVFSSNHWNDTNIVPTEFRNQFRVVHETGEFVRALELVRADLDVDIIERISQILENIHSDPEAELVRSAYHDTQRFDKPTPADLERIVTFGTQQDSEGASALAVKAPPETLSTLSE